jgi:hypothetical protein
VPEVCGICPHEFPVKINSASSCTSMKQTPDIFGNLILIYCIKCGESVKLHYSFLRDNHKKETENGEKT